MDPAALEAIFRDKPALHRYPGSMAKRTHALCVYLVEQLRRPGRGVWKGVQTGDELLARVVALPGFGAAKARIFVGLLGKRLGVRPPGWEVAAADWPSIADVDSFERVLEIREKKQAMKAAAKQAAPKSCAEKADGRRSLARDPVTDLARRSTCSIRRGRRACRCAVCRRTRSTRGGSAGHSA